MDATELQAFRAAMDEARRRRVALDFTVAAAIARQAADAHAARHKVAELATRGYLT